VRVSLDATYSVGAGLSGVGVYSRRLLWGLAQQQATADFRWLYRPHRLRAALAESVPQNVRRSWLLAATPRHGVFHALNQRMPARKRCASVVTYHDLFVMTAEYSTPEFRQRFTQQATEAARLADRIICVSQFTAGQCSEVLGFPRERIDVVPHGVDLPEKIVPLEQRRPMVLFLGALQKRKNLLRLIEAFTALPAPWELVLAGGEGYEAEAISEAAKRSPAADRISLPGYVSDEKRRRLLAEAAIFAFPSLDEGFGIPVLEAMAAGTPVLCSNASALPEVCGDAAVLLDPMDTAAWREALLQLSENAAQRKRLVEAGRQRAAGFGWEQSARLSWQVYQRLGR
jgi:glycosyltransferase involved in cell wall biosynthesis